MVAKIAFDDFTELARFHGIGGVFKGGHHLAATEGIAAGIDREAVVLRTLLHQGVKGLLQIGGEVELEEDVFGLLVFAAALHIGEGVALIILGGEEDVLGADIAVIGEEAGELLVRGDKGAVGREEGGIDFPVEDGDGVELGEELLVQALAGQLALVGLLAAEVVHVVFPGVGKLFLVGGFQLIAVFLGLVQDYLVLGDGLHRIVDEIVLHGAALVFLAPIDIIGQGIGLDVVDAVAQPVKEILGVYLFPVYRENFVIRGELPASYLVDIGILCAVLAAAARQQAAQQDKRQEQARPFSHLCNLPFQRK